ncbi:MAG: IS1595 family transposase [Terracidiphilus sp.]
MRWPDGIRCAICGCARISRIERKKASKNVRTSLYQCLEPTCKQQFSVTSGTIFHDTRIPLSKWFMAISLVMEAKKGMSAMQLKRTLWGDHKGSYQTAWHMMHRIREAMGDDLADRPKLTGIVEMDESYLGGVKHGRRYQGRRDHKNCIVGIKQRGGDVRFFHAPDAKIETLAKYLEENVSRDVEAINTDELPAYPKALRLSGHDLEKHMTVNHTAKVYVDGDATTNGIESAFSLFKRGVLGSFHKISIKHLHRYLSEFEFRFNERKSPQRFETMVSRTATTSPLPYRTLVGNPDLGPF